MEKELEKLWEILNQHGIYTEEELLKVEKDLKLDISIFTTPIPKKYKEKL